MQDESGKIRMRKVIDKGLSLSSKKRKIKKKVELRLPVKKVELSLPAKKVELKTYCTEKVELKTCLEERSIPTMTTGKNTLRLPVKKVELKTYCIEKMS